MEEEFCETQEHLFTLQDNEVEVRMFSGNSKPHDFVFSIVCKYYRAVICICKK